MTFVALTLLVHSAQATAQALVAGSADSAAGSGIVSASTNDSSPRGILAFTRNLNVSLVTTGQHDSSSGWSSILAPGLAYRFNNLFSLTASAPLYTYVNVEARTGTKTHPVYVLKTKNDVFGDTSIAAHLDTHPQLLDYSATIALGLPSGNTAYGLGAGQPTYDINNHFEKGIGIFSPNVELGIGDSSALMHTQVRKNYIAVGTLAQFQGGASVDLPFKMGFEADAYEELPFHPTVIYSTTGKGKKKVTTATNVGNAEDNGITTSLDIPFTGHVTLSGFYDHSIRNQDDIAGFSLTLLLKAPPAEEDAQ